ncbi:serine/threonine-protein phosphatase 6 regulatory ankyrin repeat subunit B-like isoform X4 [Zophobas morio]|uniref:serine/threonine-protein phosphatase 6 regulatory ankyrin repeat subunit B-like isoform X4 n=1 Tax=Zophobas morio TaxID=2755281 RepID=UPI003083D6B5
MADEALLIGQPEDLPPSPISRFLSMNMIKYQFLDKIDLQKSLVVVSCEPSITTFKKQFPHVEAIDVDEFLTDANSGTKQDEFVVLSEKDISKEEFATICKKVPRGRHCYHLRYFSSMDGFEWVRSSTKSQNLTQFLLSDTFIEESELTPCEDDNINLVCADPGMGKTTLAKTLKNISAPTTWSVLIYVRDHSKYFREKGDNVDNFKTYIANTIKTQNSHFDFQVVEALLADGRVKYFWDGLDELSDNGFRTVKSIIKELSKADYSQHWITCRSLLREDLENYFHVLSRTLKEFDEDDQKTYLKNRLECSDDETDKIFAKIRYNIRLFPHNDILGIPLQIYILSELLLRDRHRYSLLLDKIFSIADLYKRFVKEKFRFHFREKEGIENMEEENDLVKERIDKEINNQIDHYEVSALRLYFDETVLQKFDIKTELNTDKDRAGFITDVGDKRAFFHNSFGEYFAAAYLAQHREKLLHIQNFTFDSKYNNIRFFFDLILAKKSPIHVAVLYKNHHLVENFQDREFREVDKGGRSVLEVACLWCEKYPVVNVQVKENNFVVKKPPQFRNMKPEPEVNGKILALLLQKCGDKEIRRVLHQDSIFHERNYIRVLPLILLTKKTNKRTDLFTENIFTFLQYCVLFDYEDLIDTCEEIWQTRDSSGRSIIYQIVQYKSMKVMKAIAAIKKDEKFLAENEENLLQLACVNGDYEMADFLIQHGANLNSVDSNKKTPIHHACFGGNYAICRLLLKHGAHLQFETAFSKTLLHHCCRRGFFGMVQLLIKCEAPLNFKDTYGRTPLHLACAYGHYAIAEHLTTLDITIDVEDLDGKTPFYNAICGEHDEIYELLLKTGAYLDYRNRKGLMYIHMACKWGHNSVVNFLVEKRTPAVLNWRDSKGLTSVHHCCINKRPRTLSLVITNGADVNLVDTTYGRTPLHYVCKKNTHYEIVVMLLENGAALERTDNSGTTPLSRACCTLNNQIVQLLVQKGANCNSCTNDGRTPLHHASVQGLNWIIKFLIENGAEINIPDKSGRTPLNYAIANNHHDAIEILT